ncbi:MAG: TraB/GumN family protein [Saprospiraceae bacterium]|nr:TraB/GumN family protein [Saprospiraceae bacterium]
MAYKPCLLWEISNRNESSYLLGSLHLGSSQFEKLQEILTIYISNCSSCALEINLDEANQIDLSSYHNLPDDIDIYNYIPEGKWEKICKQILLHAQIDLNQMRRVQPVILLNLVIQKLFNTNLLYSLDEWIYFKSKELNKSISGLEDLRQHYDTLKKIPLKLQFDILEASLINLPKFNQQMKSLIHYYLRQDIRSLYRLAKRYCGSSKNILLKERNIIMSNRLEQLIEKKSVFAVAGAGHLYGKYGLIALLKSKSFKLKPVYLKL